MELINLTGHDVTILYDDNTVAQVIPSLGNIRVNQTTIRADGFDPITNPISHTTYGEANIPAESFGRFYIVSSIVRQAYPNRKDLLLPSETVYQKAHKGKILLGCHSLDKRREV